MLRNIAVFIPIKEHSERVPNKNFLLINGKPLHNILIDRLIKSKIISKIYVNTDSKKIIDYYKNNNLVKVIKRDPNVIGDFVSMNDVIDSSLDDIEEDVILQTHATNPLVTLSTFENACKEYFESVKKGFDSIFSVNAYQKRFFDKNLKPINHDPQKLIRTQDLDPLYVENSCIYIFSKSSFEKTKARIGVKPNIFIMDEYESIDIDWPNDLEIVKKLI